MKDKYLGKIGCVAMQGLRIDLVFSRGAVISLINRISVIPL